MRHFVASAQVFVDTFSTRYHIGEVVVFVCLLVYAVYLINGERAVHGGVKVYAVERRLWLVGGLDWHIQCALKFCEYGASLSCGVCSILSCRCKLYVNRASTRPFCQRE